MSTVKFTPGLRVIHRSRVPHPILPVNYGFFLFVPLPEKIALLPLEEQLVIAKAATARRRAYPFTGPFGKIITFEFRCSPTCSIYLDREGDFAT